MGAATPPAPLPPSTATRSPPPHFTASGRAAVEWTSSKAFGNAHGNVSVAFWTDAGGPLPRVHVRHADGRTFSVVFYQNGLGVNWMKLVAFTTDQDSLWDDSHALLGHRFEIPESGLHPVVAFSLDRWAEDKRRVAGAGAVGGAEVGPPVVSAMIVWKGKGRGGGQG